jgi:hypothetical protein
MELRVVPLYTLILLTAAAVVAVTAQAETQAQPHCRENLDLDVVRLWWYAVFVITGTRSLASPTQGSLTYISIPVRLRTTSRSADKLPFSDDR